MIRVLHVATVLTVYGIETRIEESDLKPAFKMVATVLTVYGIETLVLHQNSLCLLQSCNSPYRLRY